MTQPERVVRVLMVCLGNICRSPTAHAVFQNRIDTAGLGARVEVDSAGTADYHIGSSPDKRSIEMGAQHGYDLSQQRARQVQPKDFDTFDYLLAMDLQNLEDLRSQCPSAHARKLYLMMDFGTSAIKEVPDPYYGGDNGFEKVLKLVEDAADGLIAHISERILR